MICIGLGGNIGTEDEILERFRHAREALVATRSAALYRSAPVGPSERSFLNTAIALRDDDMRPAELLATIHEIEFLLGRRRETEPRWGARTIDLDILTWDDRVIDTPEMRVPHPELARRKFALAPLRDLVGEDAMLPLVGRLGDALARVRDQDCVEISVSW